MRTRLIPVWPFDLRRQTWLGAAAERLRLRRPRIAIGGVRQRVPVLPSLILPKPAQAPSLKVPVESTHGDEALRWSTVAALRAFRHNVILRRLSRLSERLAVALVRRTLAHEEESRAADLHGEAHDRRKRFLKAVPKEREHELTRQLVRLTLVVTAALWLLETSIMIMPWHLFGAPSLPFFSYGSQTATTSAFALLRALLLSLVLVAAAKFVGGTIKAHVMDSLKARRVTDTVLVAALAVSTLLLLRATSEMQAAYLAIVSGGVSMTLPSSVFFVVTLFVVVASTATGFWACSPLAERRQRFDNSEHAAWQRRRRAAKRLDRREAAVSRLEIRRRSLLKAVRELEHEQYALAEAKLAERRDANWPLYGLTPRNSAKADLSSLEPVGMDKAPEHSFVPRAPRQLPDVEASDAAEGEQERSSDPSVEQEDFVEEPVDGAAPPRREDLEPIADDVLAAARPGPNGAERRPEE